jgi:hypothetical protein
MTSADTNAVPPADTNAVPPADENAAMMWRRREAINGFATLPKALTAATGFADVELDATDALAVEDRPALVRAICDRLVRDKAGTPGAVLVSGLGRRFGADLAAARAFHVQLFDTVWQEFRRRCPELDDGRAYECKSRVLSDGRIPEADFGSRWSFKKLHADRSAELFSHMYGPNSGFSGGEVLLVDARAFVARLGVGFDDAFEWSDEAGGSKPVLRERYADEAVETCGRNLGQLTEDSILFINNQPSAGVLHGATGVVVADEAEFVRQYHRCSASERSAPDTEYGPA